MNRRQLITGLISLVAAPAIVRAGSLMPVKQMLPLPVSTGDGIHLSPTGYARLRFDGEDYLARILDSGISEPFNVTIPAGSQFSVRSLRPNVDGNRTNVNTLGNYIAQQDFDEISVKFYSPLAMPLVTAKQTAPAPTQLA